MGGCELWTFHFPYLELPMDEATHFKRKYLQISCREQELRDKAWILIIGIGI